MPLDERPPDLNGVAVLVVDDEADARELARRILVGAGATVHTAGSADDAEVLLDRHPVNVVVCDVGMPGRDGYGLIASFASGPGEGGVCSCVP